MADYVVDIVIIGGGLIGATLMQALLPSGFRCLLVDKQSLSDRLDADFDTRSIALSAASLRILRTLGIWSSIASSASPIERIHVSEQGRFGTACIEPKGTEPLGYVVDVQALSQALHRLSDSAAILAPATVIAFDAEQRVLTIQMGERIYTIAAQLFVAADGSDSLMRSFCHLSSDVKDYGQHALVTNIGLARGHDQVAYERFTPFGPLALLPLGPQRMALVWSLPPNEALRMKALSDVEFLQALRQVFGYRLGRLVKVGRRVVYPLRQVFMQDQVCGSVVFIGNAAHTLHPIAGQGFNLGLRDVAMLAQTLLRYGIQDLGVLARYSQSRQHDQGVMTRCTHFLIDLYTHQGRGPAMARQLGLVTFDNSRRLKDILSRYASGFAGVVPDLVCGIPLQE